MSAALLALLAATTAPADHYNLTQLLRLRFEVKAATTTPSSDMLYLQGRLKPGGPVILVRCPARTIVVSDADKCSRIY